MCLGSLSVSISQDDGLYLPPQADPQTSVPSSSEGVFSHVIAQRMWAPLLHPDALPLEHVAPNTAEEERIGGAPGGVLKGWATSAHFPTGQDPVT